MDVKTERNTKNRFIFKRFTAIHTFIYHSSLRHKIAPGHDQEYTDPAGGGDGFVEDEHGGNHPEDVAHGDERVGAGKGVVLEDVHPEDSAGAVGCPARQPPPIGELREEERTLPRERPHLLEREFQENLSRT